MSQLRLDPLTGRWIVISSDRADRPAPFAPSLPSAQEDPSLCPFCRGNEEATPPALETYGPDGAWLVRVVPNLYPAFSGSEPMAVHNSGPVFIQAPASGIHEVVVFSPDHDLAWADFKDDQTELLMAAVAGRVEEHAAVPGIRYSQFITNSGREAGASLDHPHGQLLGIPFVPVELMAEQAGFSRFAGACLLCTVLDAEEDARHRIVAEDDRTLTVCPYWSGTPMRCWFCPVSTSRSSTGRGPTTRTPWRGPCATRWPGCAGQWATSPTTSCCTTRPSGPAPTSTGTSTCCPR